MRNKLIMGVFLIFSLLFLAACSNNETPQSGSGASGEAPAASGEAPAASGEAPAASGEAPAASKANTLTAISVDEVGLDASAGFWGKAPKLTVPTEAAREDEPNGPDVSLQAAYDKNSLVIRAEWSDATESVLKSAWTYDGSAFSKSGNEDRIMFAFPIGNNAEFSSKGCAAACHNQADNEDEWWMGSDSEDVLYDAWHWKAARTHPVGQADDKWWGTQEDPTDVESSRHGDAKESGGQTKNVNEAGDGPAFMHGSDLKSAFIFLGEETEIDMGKLKEGAVIPGYIVEKLVGSRGDISAKGVWEGDKWVVVFMRDLDTAHDDDIAFTPPKPVSFGMSVIDDGGGLDHANGPDVLTLEWE